MNLLLIQYAWFLCWVQPIARPVPAEGQTKEQYRHTVMPRAGFKPVALTFEPPKSIGALHVDCTAGVADRWFLFWVMWNKHYTKWKRMSLSIRCQASRKHSWGRHCRCIYMDVARSGLAVRCLQRKGDARWTLLVTRWSCCCLSFAFFWKFVYFPCANCRETSELYFPLALIPTDYFDYIHL